MGFVVGLTPLSCEFMAWRGSGGFGVATGTASVWFGGLLLILGGLGEFILGNTFPFVVFMGYGAHFLTYSTTFMPAFNAIAFFNAEAPADATQITPVFAASYGTNFPSAARSSAILILYLSLLPTMSSLPVLNLPDRVSTNEHLLRPHCKFGYAFRRGAVHQLSSA